MPMFGLISFRSKTFDLLALIYEQEATSKVYTRHVPIKTWTLDTKLQYLIILKSLSKLINNYMPIHVRYNRVIHSCYKIVIDRRVYIRYISEKQIIW